MRWIERPVKQQMATEAVKSVDVFERTDETEGRKSKRNSRR